MKGKVVLITGANRGIGLFTAKGLAQLGASIVMVCRDVQHSIKVYETIKSETGQGGHLGFKLVASGSWSRIRKVLAWIETSRKKQYHIPVFWDAVAPFSKQMDS